MKVVSTFLGLCAILFSTSLFSQPLNDNCADAITLSVGTECISEDYTSISATAEDLTIAENPTCGFYQGGDVWFSFEVPASGNFRIDLSGNSYSLYEGSCGAFTEILCESKAVNFARPDLSGETLYIRAFRFNNASGNDFSLCVWEINPPANDNCANATSLALGTECISQDYSTKESTSEDASIAANPSCGFYQGTDSWFSFEVPASGNFRVESSSTQYVLYTGSCGSFTEIDCNSGSFNYRESGLAGQTVYLRTYRFNSSQGSDYSLCVWEYSPQPNDNCADAITLPIQTTCNYQTFSHTLSTAEDVSVAENPSCGFYQGGDTWFTFTVPASGQFRIDATNSYWSLYEGSCGGFTELVCDNGALNFNDPTLAGETLYLRTFRFNNDQGSIYDICITAINTPANDNCANALEIAFSDTCLSEAFSTQFTTAESEDIAPNPSCGFFQGGDIWFSFQAPPMGQFTLNRPSGTQQLAFYTGSCGDFTEILCEGDDEIIFDDPSLGGETIFIRAFRFNNRQGSDFELCLLTDELSPNDDCADAIGLNVNPSECNYNFFGSYNATDEVGVADPSCGQYQGDDIWFTFEVPANGKFAIQRQNVVGNFGYSLYTGTCGSFSSQICANTPQQNVFDNPALAGQTLYLRAWNRNSTIGGVFGLCIVEVDCNNTIGGTAFIDNCDDCVGGTTGIEECVPDCNGDFGGTAFIDECDDCVGGLTGLEACVQDCNGDFGGTAFIDNCGTCVEGNTGLEACLPDCNGDFGGTAFLDTCEECVGGDTGEEPCCPIPFPALDEASLTTQVNATNVNIGWGSILGQVGCQVQLRLAGATSLLGSTIVGGDTDAFTIPGSVLQINQNYEWRVRCGCSQTPVIAGPFSSWQFFSTAVDASITAAPNPVSDNTTITVKSDFADNATVAVFDLNGRQVAQLYAGEIQADQSYRLTFDASSLPNGVYICRYTGQSKTTITKIMVAR
ncbi:T9SS type A sorting domain-containing protein [Cryomorphaceae bacterium 1068]|nr:T9SS type A sorting domain-containing protein [Cryomorphaceae bacterium 1068]